jgi:thiol-disulfide isomerase/thioredoxin
MAKQVPQSGGRSAASKSAATTAQRTSATTGAAKTPPAKTPQTKGAASPLSRGAARRRSAKQPWWRQNMPIIITLVSVVLIVGIFFLIARQNTSSGGGGIGDPVPTDVLNAVTKPDPAIFAKVGTGGLSSPMTHVAGDPLKGANGKPEIFYFGAEYCPYCAAERWSLVMAMSRFGEYKDLRLMKSGPAPEAFPDTNTFTYLHSTYTSQYVDWASVETADRNGQTLQTPTADQLAIVNKYDAPPYTQQTGSIPFVTYANQYITIGAGFQNSSIQDLTWQEIASKLSNPDDPVTKNIVGNANYLTAAICQSTNNEPASVCQAAPIPDIQKQINK